MRSSLPLLLALITLSGCTLDSEGLGEYASAGGSSAGGTGGGGGTAQADASAGSGGTAAGGAGGSGASGGSSGAGGSGASGGSSGTGATGGSAPDGGNAGSGGDDGGSDASPDTPPDQVIVEDCFNGIDDDGDGDADCGDQDCGAVIRCVPAPPPGWSAPGFLRTRAAGEPAAACVGFEAGGTFHQALSEGTHSCACGCGLPSGGVCTGGSAQLFSAQDCAGVATSITGNACFPFATSIGTSPVQSIQASAPAPSSQGTCASFVTAVSDAPSWTDAADLCTAKETFAGCGAGALCIDKPPLGFPPTACVARTGSAPCPPDYPVWQSWYTGFTDERDCQQAGCTCGVASGAKCGGTIRIHSDAACGATTTVRSYEMNGTCIDTQLQPSEAQSIDMHATGPSGGSCTPGGNGTKTGSVSLSGQTTICCQPVTD